MREKRGRGFYPDGEKEPKKMRRYLDKSPGEGYNNIITAYKNKFLYCVRNRFFAFRKEQPFVEIWREKVLASKLFLLYYNITTAYKNKFLYCVRNRFFAFRKEQPFVEIWREKALASKLFLLYYKNAHDGSSKRLS